MERKIVALNGTIGSGKDTFSDVFINNGWKRVSFAGTLKDAVSVIFGWNREMLEGSTPEARKIREEIDPYWSAKFGKDITPRYILQYFGTDVLRSHLHNDIWINSLERQILQLDSDKIIVTDCRFPNELNMIRSNNGIVIEIQRILPEWYDFCSGFNIEYHSNKKTNPNYIVPATPADIFGIHPSEYEWIGINNPDYIVKNNTTISDLEEKAYLIMNEIEK